MTKQDALRLQEILQLLCAPFAGHEAELSVGTILDMSFHQEKFPIYRRKIVETFKLTGHFWRNGYPPTEGKRDETTRTIKAGGFSYVRECNGEYVDVEARVTNTKYDPVTKKRINVVEEWLTCSISLTEYDRITQYLGPKDSGCKHKDLNDDLSLQREDTQKSFR